MIKHSHNQKIMDIFLSVVKNLNQINIIPIVYGSLGLSLIIGEKYTINDIDLIIFDEDFNKKWDIIKNKIMPEIGYKIDATHCQEFNGNNIPISILKTSEIQKLTKIQKNLLTKTKIDQTKFYNLSLDRYLNIYQNGLLNQYRKQKKDKEDNQKIDLIKKHLKK